MTTAWIAIVGTIIGASTSYFFQRLTLRRTEGFARSEQLRARRIDAYSEFAEKVMDWRRAQTVRLRRRIEAGKAADDYDGLRAESQRLRAQAWSAFYKVKLLCGDPAIEQLALSAIEATHEMWDALGGEDEIGGDRQRLDELGEQVRERLDRFLEAAAAQALGSERSRRGVPIDMR